jgi:hypothetical protein
MVAATSRCLVRTVSMIMPALFPIILATQIVLAADSAPKFDLERTCRGATAQTCLGAIRRHASKTSKLRAANSRKCGANTTQHSEASAIPLSQPAAHQVMWSC